MMPWTRAGLRAALLAAVATASVVGASPALADLPRTYRSQAVDPPQPSLGATSATQGRFGLGLANVGDVNNDGKDDVLTGTDKHGTVLGQGQVAVISGADGSILRTYQLPDVDSAGGSPLNRPSGFGSSVGKVADLGSCQGFAGTPGELCARNPIDGPDGVPEHLVAASGVDIDPITGAPDAAQNNDLGVAYVFDGRTGALLKRLVMPAGDRAAQAALDNNPWFGRTVLSPSGQPPCAGFGGVAFPDPANPASDQNACPYAANSPSAIGSLDGDALPEIIVGASTYRETPGTAHAQSECAMAPSTAQCRSAGRLYVYSGAAIAGSNPQAVLDTATTVRSPVAQPDANDPAHPFADGEEFGVLLIPVGDVGGCNSGPKVEPAAVCGDPFAGPQYALDGRPDFVAVASGYKIGDFVEAGTAILLDGANLARLKKVDHPQPRAGSAFGTTMNGAVGPALGQAAGTDRPDFYVPDIMWTGSRVAQGRGFLVEGSPFTRGSFREVPASFVDPAPQTAAQWGAAAGGIGNVVGDSKRELMIGGIGPHNPATNPDVINDVHLFDPITADVLQTLRAPDRQGGLTFGAALAPLGDVNDDGFLDYAVGAGFYDLNGDPCQAAQCPNAGRVYLFRSDDSPAPPAPPPSPPAGTAGPAGPQGPAGDVLAGRTVELVASRSRIRRGQAVTLRGAVEAFANAQQCESGQSVALQRRGPRAVRYRTFKRVRTNRRGDFRGRIRPKRTNVYRARVALTRACRGAVSNREQVSVRRRRR